MVQANWNGNVDILSAIHQFTEAATIWNRETFKHIEGRQKRLLAKINSVQMAIEENQHSGLINQEAMLIGELKVTLAQEELLWNQKSRQNWALLGDRNSSFFHKKSPL